MPSTSSTTTQEPAAAPEEKESTVTRMSDDPVMAPLYESLKDLMGDDATDPPPDETQTEETEKAPQPDADAVVPEHMRKPTDETESSDEPEATSDESEKTSDSTETSPEDLLPAPPPIKATLKKEKPVTKDELKELIEGLKKSSPAAESTDSDGEPELTEEEKDDLEFAEYAEKAMPDKYSGLTGKLKNFYARRSLFVNSAIERDGTAPDEHDPEYMDFVGKNYPTMKEIDRRRIERQRIEESVYSKLKQETDSVKRDLELRTKAVEAQPAIEKSVSEFSKLLNDELPVADGDRLRKDVFEKKVKDAANVAASYLRVAEGVDAWDPDHVPAHRWLNEFVHRETLAAKANGRGVKEVNGTKKTFLPMHEYAELFRTSPDKAKDYWTFTHADILERLRARAKEEADKEVSETEATARRYGFVRGAAPAKSEKTEEPSRMKPPSSGPAPAPPGEFKEKPRANHPADLLYSIFPDMPKPGDKS